MRVLNSDKTEGLKIRAFFAHPRQPVNFPLARADPEEKAAQSFAQSSAVAIPEEEIVYHPPITVQYDVADNDVFEKVTAFERKKTPMSSTALVEIKLWKQLTMKSKGSYDVEEVINCRLTSKQPFTDLPLFYFQQLFIYNQQLFQTHQSYQCSNCSNCDCEALVQCKSSLLLFCSTKCSLLNSKSLMIEQEAVAFAQPIKVKDKVIMLSIINEKCIYVCRSDFDGNHLMNNVLKYSKRAQKLTMLPELGDVVLAEFKEDVYRAEVIDVCDEQPCVITVRLIDYGNTLRVFLKDLLIIGQECRRLECAAQKVILKDVKIDTINCDIIFFLDKLLDDKTELSVTEKNSGEVVLVHKLTEISINQRIVELSVVKESSGGNDGFLLSDVGIKNCHTSIPLFT